MGEGRSPCRAGCASRLEPTSRLPRHTITVFGLMADTPFHQKMCVSLRTRARRCPVLHRFNDVLDRLLRCGSEIVHESSAQLAEPYTGLIAQFPILAGTRAAECDVRASGASTGSSTHGAKRRSALTKILARSYWTTRLPSWARKDNQGLGCRKHRQNSPQPYCISR